MTRRPVLSPLLCIILAGCILQPAAEPTVLPAATQPQSTATVTIEWFPATQTNTPVVQATLQPTVDRRPGLEEVLYTDDFSNPQGWASSTTAAGRVAYEPGTLVMAITQPRGTLTSLSKELLLENFYLEITTTASMCRDKDAYGLLLRTQDVLNTYRLLVACSGMLRLERLINGQVVALQDWTASGQVPPGSPLVLKVGVWANSAELRVFVNDVFQFSVVDRNYPRGGLGLFARSAGDTPLTVLFSGLEVRGVNPSRVPPTATATATVTPTPRP